ncbi:hypothetical protein Hdeb2414_s0007g00261951 [Helianthus debilis subsp. tardiflorus]
MDDGNKKDDLGNKNDGPESSSADKTIKTLHPAYSVTNIQSKIRILDGVKVTYTSWVKLFRLHALAYQVLDHIDGSPSPAETDADFKSWQELDALVLQWIYSTVSDSNLPRVLDAGPTARHAWLKLEKVYLSNKKARAGALETKFCNLTLAACSSLDDYCERLKDLANQLEDVDHPVTEERLVLQLVRGLPAEYDTMASLINANNADWDLARSMLQDEIIRQEARQKTTHSVLVSASGQQPNTTHNRTPAGSQSNPTNQPQQPYYNQPQQPYDPIELVDVVGAVDAVIAEAVLAVAPFHSSQHGLQTIPPTHNGLGGILHLALTPHNPLFSQIPTSPSPLHHLRWPTIQPNNTPYLNQPKILTQPNTQPLPILLFISPIHRPVTILSVLLISSRQWHLCS